VSCAWAWRSWPVWSGIYLPGVVQLKLVLAFDWPKALAVGFAPFILWDIIKAVLAVVTYRFLAARRLLPR